MSRVGDVFQLDDFMSWIETLTILNYWESLPQHCETYAHVKILLHPLLVKEGFRFLDQAVWTFAQTHSCWSIRPISKSYLMERSTISLRPQSPIVHPWSFLFARCSHWNESNLFSRLIKVETLNYIHAAMGLALIMTILLDHSRVLVPMAALTY